MRSLNPSRRLESEIDGVDRQQRFGKRIHLLRIEQRRIQLQILAEVTRPSDITWLSRKGSMGGFVTCAKRCLQ